MPRAEGLGNRHINWLRNHIRKQGPTYVLKSLWYGLLDTWYDVRNGTHTLARVHPNDVETDSENRHRSKGYGATRALSFSGIMDRLKLPRNCTFVDLGSGKGRVLLLAAEYGFDRIVGIEFSKELCQIARENLEVFQQRRPSRVNVEVQELDVTAYHFGPTDQVLFLFDSFDSVILTAVLANLRQSLQANPRPVWLIYYRPTHHETVQRSGVFSSSERHFVRGIDYQVYSTGV